MSENKEDPLCNAQNHRQQLLHHQQELERDLEAGSCDEFSEDTGEEGVDGEDVEEGNEPAEPAKENLVPWIYNVEPGCTALGCYSAIATMIVMILGIIALLCYSSPANARADNLDVKLMKQNKTLMAALAATDPPPK